MSYHGNPPREERQLPLLPGVPAAEAEAEVELQEGDVVTWRAKKKLGGRTVTVDALGRVTSVKRKWAQVRSWGVDWRVKLEDLTLVSRPDDGWAADGRAKPDPYVGMRYAGSDWDDGEG